MIRHVWSVLCSKVSVDSRTNNISLFEVLESVQFMTSKPLTFPASVPFEATLVTLWARQDPSQSVQGEMRVRLLAPNGDELGLVGSEIDLRSSHRSRVIASISGLPIAGDGIHDWEIAWRAREDEAWHVATSLPLEVSVQVDQPAVSQIDPPEGT